MDQVQDVHGNVIDYQWWKFQGSYGGNNGDDVWVYDIHGRLGSIEYGKNVNAGAAGAHHTGRVTFDVAGRCFATQAECDDPSKRHLWMDTPWDQHCHTWAVSCGVHTPTFWNLYRLINISTYVWDPALGGGVGGFPADLSAFVDQFATVQGFAATGDFIAPAGDDSAPSLWMSHLWRPGFTAPMEFGGMALDNRVDYGTGKPPMRHWRVGLVNSGTAEYVYVDYSVRDCNGSSLPAAADQNTRRCYGQKTAEQLSWWHRYVVTDVTSRDYAGGAPDERWHYDYSTANSTTAALWKIDQNWHQPPSERTWSRWAGYPTVHTTHGAADGSGPQQITESLFYRGMHGDATFAGFDTRLVDIDDGWDHTIPDHQALAGQTRRTFTWNGTPNSERSNWANAIRHHHLVTQTGSQAIQSNPTIVAHRVRETETLTGTVLAGPADRWTHTVSTYDPVYGLPTTVEDHGDTGVAGDERCVLTSYTTPDTTKWLIGLPKETLTTTCATSPAQTDYLGGQQIFYDGSTTLGATPVKGLVTKTTSLATATAVPLASTDWKQASRTAGHDAYGRAKDSFDPLDRKTTTTYVPAAGQPTSVAVSVTPPAGGSWTTTTSLSAQRGQPVKVVDANGKVGQAEYDGDGRLTKVWLDNRAPGSTDGITPDVEYGYRIDGQNWVSTTVLHPDHTEAAPRRLTSYEILDGRLRPRQTQVLSATGSGRTITDTVYNGLGVAAKVSLFYNSSSPAGQLGVADDALIALQDRAEYDNLGRLTSLQPWTMGSARGSSWNTIFGYDGDREVRTTPQAGATATTTLYDVRGHVVELRQHQGGTTAGAFIATRYTYDRLGQLKTTVDAASNQWSYTYDLLGRQTQATDPDSGTSTTKYDNAGQVIETVDGANRKLAYDYDTLGRPKAVHDNTLAGFKRLEYTYDTLQKGRLSTVTRFDGPAAYVFAVTGYDNAYRRTGEKVTIPTSAANGLLAGDYTSTASYKANGAPATQVLPAAGGLQQETLTYGYNAAGLPITMSGAWTGGSQTYIASTGYDYDAAPLTVTLGTAGKQVRQTNVYDPATRRLTQNTIATETATVGTFQNKYSTDYSYDQAGNVMSMAGKTGGVADQQECFTYDYLLRLTEAWTQTSGACTTPQRTGADPYWRKWTFDDIGNRATQVDKDSAAGDTTWTYRNGAAYGGKAHQAKRVEATGPKAGIATRTFNYDNAGNTSTATTTTGAAQTHTTDVEGHLTSLVQGASTYSYLYRPDGRRLIANDPSTVTLYLGATELSRDKNTGTVTGTRLYGVATRTAAGLTWTLSDHHGTETITAKATDLTHNRRRSMPYGETRGTQPTWPNKKGYVGGDIDPTGLTHLGAREYDPSLGRFTAVDPIIDHANPQQWHGYAYAYNSPVAHSDPTGLLAPKVPGTGGGRGGSLSSKVGSGGGGVGIIQGGGRGGGAKIKITLGRGNSIRLDAARVRPAPSQTTNGGSPINSQAGGGVFNTPKEDVDYRGDGSTRPRTPTEEEVFQAEQNYMRDHPTNFQLDEDPPPPPCQDCKGRETTPTTTGSAPPEEFTKTHSIEGGSSSKWVYSLMQQMRVDGYTQEPISVVIHEGRMYVVDGHHRLAAARRAGVPLVPFVEVMIPFHGYRSLADLLEYVKPDNLKHKGKPF